MWRDVGTFVRAVVKHWVWAVTSTILAAAFWAAPVLGITAIPRAVHAAAAIIAALTACFLAWREQYRRASKCERQLNELHSAGPEIKLRPHTSAEEVFVDVVNVGAVQAKVEVRARFLRAIGGRERFDTAWRQGVQGPRLIAPGESHTLLLAKLQVNNGFFRWLLQSPRPQRGEHRRYEIPMPSAHVRMPDEGSFELILSVVAEPQLQRPVQRTLRFREANVTDDDSGETVRLQGHFSPLLRPNPR
jgi:hypothetical protein